LWTAPYSTGELSAELNSYLKSAAKSIILGFGDGNRAVYKRGSLNMIIPPSMRLYSIMEKKFYEYKSQSLGGLIVISLNTELATSSRDLVPSPNTSVETKPPAHPTAARHVGLPDAICNPPMGSYDAFIQIISLFELDYN
jgi:hypothetical protein